MTLMPGYAFADDDDEQKRNKNQMKDQGWIGPKGPLPEKLNALKKEILKADNEWWDHAGKIGDAEAAAKNAQNDIDFLLKYLKGPDAELADD